MNVIRFLKERGLLLWVFLILLAILNSYLNYNAEQHPLIKAINAKDAKRVEMLLREGININVTGEHLKTPLHIASENGTIEIVKLLLEHGANVNARTMYKGTPLHFAASGGDIAIAELLIEKGAQADARDDEGRTPRRLLVGRKWATPEMIDLLELHEDAAYYGSIAENKVEYDRVVEFLRKNEKYRKLKNSSRQRSDQEFEEYITRLKNLR